MRPFPAALLAAILLSSCRSTGEDRPTLVQPGAPGAATRTITAAEAADTSRVQPTASDVRFMQGMIGHHAQALEMTALLPSRTDRDDMRLLARRIELSQADEIAMMQRWLRARGQSVPDAHAHHDHAAALMPGMLTAEDMRRLGAATGKEFDRLFLEFMIKHHDGALIMVNDLFATAGAGQEPEIFAFASDVDADQRIEIDRMSALLLEILK
ncbi:MAG TPA: DUF305 domain-containing protein [Vicinamibacterales bacterium]|nr:DUF305 domain-containing protein [Vicinamibacterales bacterium]